ncbi:MAG: hypothetical protein AAGK74_00755, partial [Chloroflexota bacterium]
MSRLYAILYDEDYVNQISNPFTVLDVDGERVFDGIGQGSISIPASDTDTLALLQNERIVEVYVDPVRPTAPVRMVTAFVIQNYRYSDGPSGKRVEISGEDVFAIFKRSITLPGQQYSGQIVGTILSDFIPSFSGWSFGFADAGATGYSSIRDARFDGQNNFQAFARTIEEADFHFRLSATTPKRIEFGSFGLNASFRVEAATGTTGEILNSGNVLLMDAVEIISESQDIVNAFLPISGNGDSFFDISVNTSTKPGITPRTDSRVPGQTFYWVEDSASQTTYGRHESRVNPQIFPISNSSSDAENAANAIVDAVY